MSIKPGQQRGILTDYGFGETPTKKELQVMLYFDVFVLPDTMTPETFDELVKEGKMPENLPTEQMTKFANFSGGAKEITIDMLLKMGLNPQKHSIAAVEDGPAGGALDMKKVYGLSIKASTYYDDKRPEIASVYIPGEGGGMGRKLPKGEAIGRLASLGLDGELQKRAATIGGGPVNQAPAPASSGGAKPRF